MFLNCLKICYKISPKLGPKTVPFQLKTENATQTR